MSGFYFGEVDKRKKERITIRLDKELLTNLASQENNLSEVIRKALHDYLETKQKSTENSNQKVSSEEV